LVITLLLSAAAAAGTAGQDVVISCVDIRGSFNVKLTASATSGVGCQDIKSAEANVTVLGDYNVTITPLTNLTSFCLESLQGPLTFDYLVSSVPPTSTLTLALDEVAGCSLSNTTGMAEMRAA
jgi:hypothetical protein